MYLRYILNYTIGQGVLVWRGSDFRFSRRLASSPLQ